MAAMAKRLRARGHRVMVFSYPTTTNSISGHADGLHEFVAKHTAAQLHLVGHSMGGLIILNMLSRYQDLPPGRIVLMGTPVKGSAVVRRLEKLPGQKLLFGKAREDLLEGFQHTPVDRETGMIRGTRAIGLGRVAVDHREPNDGSVAVSETQLDGLTDSVELPVAHSEMLLSNRVVEQVDHFLAHGQFVHG